MYVHRSLSDFHSVLQGPFCYLPHDAVIPGVLAVGDLCDIAAAAAPRHMWLDSMVDGLNREVPPEELARKYEPARNEFTAADVPNRLLLGERPAENESVGRWLSAALQQE